MSLKIRMARGGAKRRPFYRIVITDSRMPRDGRFIERVGTHNPMVAKDHPDRVNLKKERIKYWIGVGAKPSARVARFLADVGLWEKPPIPTGQTKKDKPRPKTLERMAAKEEAVKAAAEAKEAEAKKAAEAPAEKEAPAEEAPAEEAKAEEAPAEEAKAEEAPAEEAKAEEASAEEAKAEETKAEEAPAEEAKEEDKS